MIIAIVVGIITCTVMSLFTIGHVAIAIVSDKNLSILFINREVKSNEFLIGVIVIHLLNLIIGVAFSLFFYFVADIFVKQGIEFYMYIIQIFLSFLFLFGGLLFCFLLKTVWKHFLLEVLMFIVLYLWVMPGITSLV